jgi:hypothetical protein
MSCTIRLAKQMGLLNPLILFTPSLRDFVSMSYHTPATHIVYYYIFSSLARRAAVHVPSQPAALLVLQLCRYYVRWKAVTSCNTSKG